ncbi:FMN-binding glutamate synthase family protein [Alicyclobacillus shizuokensis]|uniref:FMN-binding glutamate synthase family protein n=1 Tax=Alicyclobacillus shizuokensis TaxID=392014 RepID=UPI00083712CC|nr:FMN-binding glutamate synthase family protein [Alicyclobacillus shizuokensis]
MHPLQTLADVCVIIAFILGSFFLLALAGIVLMLYVHDRRQDQHPVLRNFPVIGMARYFFEKIGPELRQYLYNSDTEGKPFSRVDYETIVKSAKYQRNVIGFGSQRDFDGPGYYIRNAMFPKQMEELRMDRETRIQSKKYVLVSDPLFGPRTEKWVDANPLAYLLADEDAITIGAGVPHPFVVKGQIGMSGMSFGALGSHAILALSHGLAIAQGTWMNTGEGGLSSYHLDGGVDIIMQIGPGLFGVRDVKGRFNWDELRRKAELPQVRAFELKLAQGAKARGGHIDGDKVTPEIAKIRLVEPYKPIDSPNRFHEFDDLPSLFDFMERIRAATGKPVGMKMVVGSPEQADELAAYMRHAGVGPDFITIDGGEGGTGASYQELADTVGLPIKSALPLVDAALVRHGVRDRVRLIASGKLFSPDRVAVALAMGADLVNIARGFMITVGCIQALKCHANICPVGVATTNPALEKALVVDEKKYRVANYVITMREGLFRLAAAAGLDSPVQFTRSHVVYQHAGGRVSSLDEVAPVLGRQGVAGP